MKVLVISNLFPNTKEPTRGMYNKQQKMALADFCELKIIAPIPFYRYLDMPEKEFIDGLEVFHPRIFVTPKIARSLYGYFFYRSLLGVVKNIQKDFNFDVILASWAYPDGVGASYIAKVINKPIVIEALGTDINLYTQYFLRRRIIVRALKSSDKVIAVSNALKNKIVNMGVPKEKLKVLLNGVNTELFKPLDKRYCREYLNLPIKKKIVLFIGNIAHVKGIQYLIKAFPMVVKNVSSAVLIVIGSGELKSALTRRVKELGIKENVLFIGNQEHEIIPLWMNAADVFCLPSLNEGCPNVILEALACKTTIIATKTGGIPELINNVNNVKLVSSADAIVLAQAVSDVLTQQDDSKTAAPQQNFIPSWKENAKVLYDELASIVYTKSFNIIYHHRTRGIGAEGVHIAQIINNLKKLGHNVYCVQLPGVKAEETAGDSPYGKKKSLFGGLFNLISKYSPQFLFELFEFLYNNRAYANLKKLCDKQRIDFIYERYAFFLFAGVHLAKKLNIPIMLEVNEIAGEKRVRKQILVKIAKRIEKYIFKNANAIVVVSDFLKNKISELGVKEEKIFVIPNAVDPNIFTPDKLNGNLRSRFNISKEVVLIGFIGWFVKWHNIELLIEVFSKLAKQTDVMLFLVGDGVLKDKLKIMVKELGIEKLVIFTGAIPNEHIPEYIQATDICVIPDSNDYRSPIKLFEYMAMEKSIVAPRYQPIESVVEDKIDALLFEPSNEIQFLNCLLELVNNKQKRELLGINARKKIMNNYTWVENAEKIINIYKNTAKC